MFLSRYPYIPCVRQTGAEQFTLGDQQLSADLLSFWQWSASDLIGNTMRGCLAEYIVSTALGLTSGIRNDWEAYDLKFNGYKIEVKASGYLQTWPQQRLSRPVFSIRPARAWDPTTGQMSQEIRRQADLYVFCLHDHKEKATLNPLNLSQWTFYVLLTREIEKSPFNECKYLSLARLLTLNPAKTKFEDLRDFIITASDKTKGLPISEPPIDKE